MSTYDVEVPTDLVTLRYWFDTMFRMSIWEHELDIDELATGDAYRQSYTVTGRFTFDGGKVNVAAVHFYQFRPDRTRVIVRQDRPWAVAESTQAGPPDTYTVEDNASFILDTIRSWVTAMFGADQVREFANEATAIVTAEPNRDRAYWTDVHKQAKASGNIRAYLKSRDIPYRTYYDVKKRLGL